MPHIIIDYASELASDAQLPPMVDAVHEAVVASGLFDEDHIKTRAIPVMHYRVGDNTGPYIHVQCRIHIGRSDEQRRRLSEAVLAAVRAQGWAAKVITVEVVEMDRLSYAKYTR